MTASLMPPMHLPPPLSPAQVTKLLDIKAEFKKKTGEDYPKPAG